MDTTFIEQELFVRLIQVSELLQAACNDVFKPYGLTHQQYNVLRILNGADKSGLPTREIANRMINRVPDVTRLIDRLKAKRFVSRRRSQRDRRVVKVHITEEGIALLQTLRPLVDALHRKQFSALDEQKKRTAIGILDLIHNDESV